MRTERSWELRVGDALDQIGKLEPDSVDAIITDPPYGIGIRGEAWDSQAHFGVTANDGFEGWTTRWATECLRVLKPGAYLVAFGSPRTAHRLTAGIEDAGFEIRDQLVWLFATGVAKSPLVNGRSSTLRPAYEPILLARKPLHGSTNTNEQRYGTGRLGIDDARNPDRTGQPGRWPCTVTVTHARSCRPTHCSKSCPSGLLDRSQPSVRPARFYYCAKASPTERDAGCEQLPAKRAPVYRRNTASRPRRNTHPTVKPIKLMRWLTRLSVPRDGLVLDPFAGSGSTGIAALAEGRRFVGFERDARYARIARARLRHAKRKAAAEAPPETGSG
jgi:DNA modification methylase